MPEIKARNRNPLQLSGNTIELRRRVERLDFLRAAAVLHRDAATVALIDKQIKDAAADWAESFAMDVEGGVRKRA
ncbi:MAG: hypothetical protein H7Y02_00920 [Candidatus Obscuribacterales bacterium]|nr:hypothetical protein [Steroidobacteraceae bacterium]